MGLRDSAATTTYLMRSAPRYATLRRPMVTEDSQPAQPPAPGD